MKVEAVDFFYLSMPQVLDIGDGSQDALLVRVRAGGDEGWGECEAAPLVSIASWCCPMSHSACKPVRDSVLGRTLDDPSDIERIGELVRRNSFDLLQADHTLSGIDIALWDLLGKKKGTPVYEMLGYRQAYPKTPYASALFGDDAESTYLKAGEIAAKGFKAVKLGWGPFGAGSLSDDVEQLKAAREGLGDDVILLIDAGTIWGEDVQRAELRLPALRDCKAMWLEEPFVSGAIESYSILSRRSSPVRLAGGEGAHSYYDAKNMIDFAGVGFIQIDTGRIGGITTAKRVADYANARDVTFVNHTFTTHLALSASLQPYAGLKEHRICEYPVEAKPLAHDLTTELLLPDKEGFIHLPAAPGLGLKPDLDVVRRYLVQTEITAKGQLLYRTPEL